MRKLLFIISLTLALAASAQRHEGKPQPAFNPEEFQQKMISHIIREAKLTEDEANRVMPILKEMMDKKRDFGNSKRAVQQKVCEQSSDKDAEEAIDKIDKLTIEEAQTEQTYHKKMVKVIGAKKVMTTLKAIDTFHRQMFRRNGERGRQNGPARDNR